MYIGQYAKYTECRNQIQLRGGFNMKKLKKNCKERVNLLEKVTLYESHILSGTVPESSGCQQVGTKNSVSSGCNLPKACAAKACNSCK